MAGNRSGQQLGNYRLIRLLGQGAFADVYLGEHIYLKTQAAIKILQIRLAGDDMQGFLTEARTIASLKHPHIVACQSYLENLDITVDQFSIMSILQGRSNLLDIGNNGG